jgi:hypothetical protein
MLFSVSETVCGSSLISSLVIVSYVAVFPCFYHVVPLHFFQMVGIRCSVNSSILWSLSFTIIHPVKCNGGVMPRIKVRPFEIQPSDPFSDDFFGHEMFVKSITNLAISLEEPLVLGLNAPWGHGKTTLINRLEAFVKNDLPNEIAVAPGQVT